MFHVFNSVATSLFVRRRIIVGLLNSVLNCSSIAKTYSKKVFEALDKNKDGLVDKNDLRKGALTAFLFTFDYDDDKLEKAFRKLDKERKGSVGLAAVDAYMSSVTLPPEDKLKAEFNLMDKDQDGAISFDDVAKRYNLSKGDALMSVLQHEFNMMGKSEHDKITLEEFLIRNYYRYVLATLFQLTDNFKGLE